MTKQNYFATTRSHAVDAIGFLGMCLRNSPTALWFLSCSQTCSPLTGVVKHPVKTALAALASVGLPLPASNHQKFQYVYNCSLVSSDQF